MIQEIRAIPPFIHFGFNRQTFMQKQVGRKIRVYIDGNFNKDIYSVSVVASGSTVTQVTPRIYELEYSVSGIKSIKVEFTNTQTGQVLESNEVSTDQLEYTFDSDTISFDNTIITFDNEQ